MGKAVKFPSSHPEHIKSINAIGLIKCSQALQICVFIRF